MMKQIILCLTLIVLLFTACEKKKECEKIDTYPIPCDQEARLENTKWKLVGFVDLAEGCLRKAEPTTGCGDYLDCENNYTLHFTDSVLYGHTSSNDFNAATDIDYATNSIQIWITFSTHAGEWDDGYLYWDICMRCNHFVF